MNTQSLYNTGKRIIGFVNQKGGVGKTASTLSIGTGLALSGQKVLLVDGDPQGNLSMFFTPDKKPGFYDLLRDLNEGAYTNTENYILRDIRDNLDIIPNQQRELRTLMHDTQITQIAPRFIEILREMKSSYDWILIDCSPSNGALERTLVSACDTVIVPLEFQVFSISGLSGLLDEIKVWGNETGREISVDALIFTKTEKRINRMNEYREIFSNFRIPIFEVCKSESLPKSIETGKTIWENAPTGFAAADYYHIITQVFLGTDDE
ncbi:MAG: ParA family protein [Brevinematales bacterium]|nr:ParA family protein [Brevinematales bacterium]